MSEPTEAPTPRRLARARREGDAGASPVASQSLGLVTLAILLPAAVVALVEATTRGLRHAFDAVARHDLATSFEAASLATAVVATCAPVLIAVAGTSAAGTLVQTGGVFAAAKLAPDLSRLSLIAGARRIASGPRIFAAVRAAAACFVVAGIAWFTLRDHAADLARSAGEPRHAWGLALALARTLVLRGAAALILLGVVDLAVTRRAWLERLRMTREEVRRDLRESEGDPDARAARRRAHADLLRGARHADVAGASLVIASRSRACALAYDSARGDEAPVLIATGAAGEIERVARAHGVPIVEDDALERALAPIETGQPIPEGLYEDVARAFRDARG